MRQTNIPIWLIVSIAAAFIISAIFTSFFAFQSVNGLLSLPANELEDEEIGVLQPLEQDGPIGTILPPPTIVIYDEDVDGAVTQPNANLDTPTPYVAPTTVAWDGEGRVTMLVMGIDRRPGEPYMARTDTMILLSVDEVTNSISMLSIPRDLYVNIPGYGRDRINTAYVRGAVNTTAKKGAELTMQTIQENLGVPVNHYMMVDFNAFIEIVDTLGGIVIDVPKDLNDPTYPDMNYGYDPLYIPQGTWRFDGETALKYARTRHVDSDVGRSRRQQQVILATRDQMLNLGIPKMVTLIPTLYSQLTEGTRTDLSIDQMTRLATLVSRVPAENIRQGVFDYQYLENFTTDKGAQVFLLQEEPARELVRDLFGVQ